MELTSHNSFYRDLDNTSNRELHHAIEHLSNKIRSAHSIVQIPGMKPLRNHAYGYKIELKVQSKIYWILCEAFHNKLIFVRLKSEVWCKKNL